MIEQEKKLLTHTLSSFIVEDLRRAGCDVKMLSGKDVELPVDVLEIKCPEGTKQKEVFRDEKFIHYDLTFPNGLRFTRQQSRRSGVSVLIGSKVV